MSTTTTEPITAANFLSEDFLNSQALNLNISFSHAKLIELLENNHIDTAHITQADLQLIVHNLSSNPNNSGLTEIIIKQAIQTTLKLFKGLKIRAVNRETLLNYQNTLNDLISSNIPFDDTEAISFLENVNQILEITKNSPTGKYPIDNKVVQLFDTYIPNW